MNAPPRHIIVEGPIGVGKTSLARRLAETFGANLLLEDADSNPFLERFYRDPHRLALHTQLYFLFQRARQLKQWHAHGTSTGSWVSDFMLEKDPLFARLTLDDAELNLYQEAYNSILISPPTPDLVIYLQAPVNVLLKRIERRGLARERLIEAAYLERLSAAYANFFHHYDAAPLLIVNATEIDWVSYDADYNALVDYVRAPRSGRYYLNPLPAAGE